MITKFNLYEVYTDKRTDIQSKDVIQKAIDEIRSLGYKNPFDNSTVIGDNVLVEVSNFDGYLWLNSIMTVEKGRGDASKVLDKICEIADKHQVTIVLTPVPFGRGKIFTKKQLRDWYGRHGFVKYHIEDMKRQPKPLTEKQMKLFDFPEPTDKEIAHTFIDKHKKTKSFKRPTNYRTLEEGFEAWSNNDFLCDIIYQEISNNLNTGLSDSMLGYELLYKHQSDLIDHMMENPDKSIDDDINKVIKRYENDNIDENQAHREIKNILDKYDWYYKLDDLISDREEFEEKLLNDNKKKLFNECDTEYYEDLESAVWKSEREGDGKRMLIYRAVTLPNTINNLEELEYNGVGVYWTYDFDKAEAYWSAHDREFILTAYADTNSIDWETTVHHSIYNLKEEKEIKIWDGADLELVGIFMKDFYNKQDLQKETDRISKMFNSKYEREVHDYIRGKYKNLSTIEFDPPVEVVA